VHIREQFRKREVMHGIEKGNKDEQELIQVDKMISMGVLVSGVAHEINNPNNVVMASCARWNF